MIALAATASTAACHIAPDPVCQQPDRRRDNSDANADGRKVFQRARQPVRRRGIRTATGRHASGNVSSPSSVPIEVRIPLRKPSNSAVDQNSWWSASELDLDFSGKHVVERRDIAEQPRRRAHQRHGEDRSGPLSKTQGEIKQGRRVQRIEQDGVAAFG